MGSNIKLSEFLGLEEEKEYTLRDTKLKIVGDYLYVWNDMARKWMDAYNVGINSFSDLRNSGNITLASFLGWEENTEYTARGDFFIISDDSLYIKYRNNRNWFPAIDVSLNAYLDLRREAIKVDEN